MTSQDSNTPLQFQVFYSAGPGTVPEWYLVSEWASEAAAGEYIKHHDSYGSLWAIIDAFSCGVKHEPACDLDCGAERNGLSLSPDPDSNQWYAFYLHDTVSDDEEGFPCYGASFQAVAGPVPTESSLKALIAVVGTDGRFRQ